ncbi:MAG: BamA/TamA family outer membrane protein [Pseudomonadota bacterium]
MTAPDALRADLRAASLTATLADTEDSDAPAEAIDILSAAQADYGRLIAALYDQGYFGPTIRILLDGREAASIAPIAAPGAIRTVEIIVDPGAVFTFGTVAVTPRAPQTEPTPGFAPGETARVSVLRNATQAGIEGWRQDGHAKAAVGAQSITARHPDKTVNAQITLDPGPKLRLGRLILDGDSAVRDARIREIAGWPSGEVFDPDTLVQVQGRLRRTGTFATANLTEAETPNPDGTLDVTATVTDQLPRRYSFGAEYGTLDGFSVSGSWLHRNIFGGAERLEVKGEVSGVGGDTDGVDFLLGARLSRPATYRTDLEAYALGEIAQRDDPNLFARTVRLELGGVYFASEDREYSYGIGIQRAQTRDDLGERDYTILTFPFTATFDRRDNPLNATSGYYAQAALTPFAAISGTESGLLSTLDLRTYRQVGSRVTLALRGVLGSVLGPSLEDAPADFLFFSGGSGTVRGQDYQSLGVDLSPTVTIGGRSFLGLSGEVRVKTGENLSVVGFYDAGYVGPESFIDGSGEWHTGFGAGVRYDTGIGPVRFDLAVPGSGPGDSSGVEIYIGIGQAF